MIVTTTHGRYLISEVGHSEFDVKLVMWNGYTERIKCPVYEGMQHDPPVVGRVTRMTKLALRKGLHFAVVIRDGMPLRQWDEALGDTRCYCFDNRILTIQEG